MSIEELASNILAQMPFVALLYYLFVNERSERIKSSADQIDHLLKTIDKNEERHKRDYENACKLYERFLDQAADQVKSERRRRDGTAYKTDIGDTQPKIGL